MSRSSLESFLKKIDAELTRDGSSEAWRNKTGNKLTTTITVNTTTITKTIKAAVSAATNVSKNGDILIKDLGPKYTALTTALMKELRDNFNGLASSGAGVKVLKGSRSGKLIRVRLDKIKGSKRDNFKAGQKMYQNALQTFYEDFAILVGVYLSRISTSNKTGKVEQTRQGQLFNLEHIKGKSNVQSFINDTIYDAIQSYDGSLEDLKANAKALGLKTYLNIEKNAKTGEIKVFVGSQAKNVEESSSEKKIKTDIQKALAKALKKLKDPLFEIQGSDSLKDAKRKKVLEKTLKPFNKLKNVRVESSSTKIKESKGPAKLDVSAKRTVTKLAASRLRKKNAPPARKSAASTPLAMIVRINKELPKTVQNNMAAPALENRSGRFARSVRVTDIVQTPKGFPSVGYTYQRNPYEVFEMGSSGPWSSPERDPRNLIDKSIREIAAQMAIGRFYTRRV